MNNDITINPWFAPSDDYTTQDLLRMSSTPYKHDEYGFTRHQFTDQRSGMHANQRSTHNSIPPPPPNWGEKDAKCPNAKKDEDPNMYKILFFILLIGIIVIGAGYLACGLIANTIIAASMSRQSTLGGPVPQPNQV